MLTPNDKSMYAWQLSIPEFGERGQEILRNSTALVSRVGGKTLGQVATLDVSWRKVS